MLSPAELHCRRTISVATDSRAAAVQNCGIIIYHIHVKFRKNLYVNLLDFMGMDGVVVGVPAVDLRLFEDQLPGIGDAHHGRVFSSGKKSEFRAGGRVLFGRCDAIAAAMGGPVAGLSR